MDMTAAKGVIVEGVNLSYGTTHVLKDINLEIKPGEFFAFLGPSGCGKTTLLRLIAGFNIAQTGRVLVGGEDIGALPPWKRDVGMVFQSYALWPHMTVAQNVAFGLEERKIARSEVERRVKTALEVVGLSHLAQRRPSQLSGGQQQRVALARTIVIEPKVLLLDEPLSNLDARMRVDVRRELRDLQQRLGITTIFVTHDQEEANTICDRIAVMKDGVIQQVGTPMHLYEHPANLFVAGFLGTANILDGAYDAATGRFVFARRCRRTGRRGCAGCRRKAGLSAAIRQRRGARRCGRRRGVAGRDRASRVPRRDGALCSESRDAGSTCRYELRRRPRAS